MEREVKHGKNHFNRQRVAFYSGIACTFVLQSDRRIQGRRAFEKSFWEENEKKGVFQSWKRINAGMQKINLFPVNIAITGKGREKDANERPAITFCRKKRRRL